jgi:hypothetical protein
VSAPSDSAQHLRRLVRATYPVLSILLPRSALQGALRPTRKHLIHRFQRLHAVPNRGMAGTGTPHTHTHTHTRSGYRYLVTLWHPAPPLIAFAMLVQQACRHRQVLHAARRRSKRCTSQQAFLSRGSRDRAPRTWTGSSSADSCAA